MAIKLETFRYNGKLATSTIAGSDALRRTVNTLTGKIEQIFLTYWVETSLDARWLNESELEPLGFLTLAERNAIRGIKTSNLNPSINLFTAPVGDWYQVTHGKED